MVPGDTRDTGSTGVTGNTGGTGSAGGTGGDPFYIKMPGQVADLGGV